MGEGRIFEVAENGFFVCVLHGQVVVRTLPATMFGGVTTHTARGSSKHGVLGLDRRDGCDEGGKEQSAQPAPTRFEDGHGSSNPDH